MQPTERLNTERVKLSDLKFDLKNSEEITPNKLDHINKFDNIKPKEIFKINFNKKR